MFFTVGVMMSFLQSQMVVYIEVIIIIKKTDNWDVNNDNGNTDVIVTEIFVITEQNGNGNTQSLIAMVVVTEILALTGNTLEIRLLGNCWIQFSYDIIAMHILLNRFAKMWKVGE